MWWSRVRPHSPASERNPVARTRVRDRDLWTSRWGTIGPLLKVQSASGAITTVPAMSVVVEIGPTPVSGQSRSHLVRVPRNGDRGEEGCASIPWVRLGVTSTLEACRAEQFCRSAGPEKGSGAAAAVFGVAGVLRLGF